MGQISNKPREQHTANTVSSVCVSPGRMYAHDYHKEMQIEDAERPPTKKLQAYLPESLEARHYYEPGLQGKEASIKQWLEKRRAHEQ